MDFLRSISWKRLLLMWVAMFVVLIAYDVVFVFAVYTTAISQFPLIKLVNDFAHPFVYGVFGYLYFRDVKANDWEHRLFATGAWVSLSFVVFVIISGLANKSLLTLTSLKELLAAEIPNAALMLLAGILAQRKTKPPLPEGLEV